MPKKRLKKHTQKNNGNKASKRFIVQGIKHAVSGYILLLLGLSVLALFCIKKDVSLQAIKIGGYAICAVSFLLTGIFSGLHPVFSSFKDAFYAGFLLLIALFCLLLIASKGALGAFSLLLICFGIVLPSFGSLLIQKVK